MAEPEKTAFEKLIEIKKNIRSDSVEIAYNYFLIDERGRKNVGYKEYSQEEFWDLIQAAMIEVEREAWKEGTHHPIYLTNIQEDGTKTIPIFEDWQKKHGGKL